MAKKKRKRRRRPPPTPAATQAAADAPAPAAKSDQRARPARRRQADEPPPAPWGSFPLSELVIFIGIVLLVAGFVAGGDRGPLMIISGLALASLGALEVTVREHFAGYRSHTLILSGVAAVVCLAILFFAVPSLLAPPLRLAVGAVVFGLAAWGLTVAFRRRSGGLSFKLTGFRR